MDFWNVFVMDETIDVYFTDRQSAEKYYDSHDADGDCVEMYHCIVVDGRLTPEYPCVKSNF